MRLVLPVDDTNKSGSTPISPKFIHKYFLLAISETMETILIVGNSSMETILMCSNNFLNIRLDILLRKIWNLMKMFILFLLLMETCMSLPQYTMYVLVKIY